MGVAVDPNTLQFELWTLPSSGDHKLVGVLEHVLPGATGTRELSAWADEKVPVPATEKLLTNWAGGWIRVKLGGQYIDEFLAERLVQPLGRPAVIEISGPQRNGIVEKCAVYPYNWPNHAEDAPNWNWGSERNLIRNGGAEENPHGLPNAGFEDGTPDPWQAGAVDGTSATLSVVTDDPDDGTYHAKVTALLNEGGMSTQVNVYPGRLYTFTINGKSGSSGSHDWQLGASGEGVSAAPGAYMPPDGREEALKDHTFDDSAYDEVWMQFVSGPKQTSAQLNVRYIGADPSKILYVDQVEWSGFGVGCGGWEVTNGVADFQVAQDITPSEGSYHFRAVAGQHHGPFQSIRGLAPGGTYSYRLDVAGPAAGHIWTVQIQDVRGRRIHQKTVTLTTSMAEATGTFTVPTDLPGDGTLRFWLVNRHQGQSTLYFDDVRLFEGLPAATATEIIKKVLAAAQTRGTFTFLELDATDAADTSGTALSAITFTIPWSAGVTLGTVLGGLRQQGYEWRIIEAEHAEVITPQATTTHVLQMWAPGGGPEDHTTDPAGPVILTGAKTPGGSVARRIPPFTSVLVHGEGVTIEDTNAAAEATYGRWETSVDAEAANSEATAQAVADAVFAEEQANREALSVDVLATDQHVPLIHFSEGDLVKWHLPGYVDPVAKRVRRVTWQNSTPARFGVQGSRILTAEAALAVAVRDLLLEPKRRRGSGSGGRPIVAPTEVTAGESFGAHIHLTAATQEITDAGGMVEWTVSSLHAPYNFPLAEGHVEWWAVSQRGYFDVAVAFKLDSYLGMAVEILRRRGGSIEMVWPFSSGMGEYEHGNEFDVVAGGIELQPGDEIGVKVTPGETTDVVSGSLMIQLVDRSAHVAAPEAEPGEWELVLETDPGRFGIVFDGTNWWLTVSATGASPALFKYDTSWNLVDSYSPFTGPRNYRGITYYPTDGYLYVSYDGSLEDSGHRVRRVDPSDGSTVTTGPAIGVEPFYDITVKDGDLYVRGRHANFDSAVIVDISTLEQTGSVVCHEEIDGFEWDEGNECWWVAWTNLLNPVYKVYAFSEDFQTELVEIDAPERLRGVERQGDYLYAVGHSGVWRVKVV